MNLIEALEMVKKPAGENSPSLRIFFACGFTPLHLQTFLAAHLRNLRSTRADVTTGVFGDLAGNLERLSALGSEFQVKFCLDCISSLGTVPVDLSAVYLAAAWTNGSAYLRP